MERGVGGVNGRSFKLTNWRDVPSVLPPPQNEGGFPRHQGYELPHYPGNEEFDDEVDHGDDERERVTLVTVTVREKRWECVKWNTPRAISQLTVSIHLL